MLAGASAGLSAGISIQWSLHMGQFELPHNMAAGSQMNKAEKQAFWKSHDIIFVVLYSIGQASHKGCLSSRGGVKDHVNQRIVKTCT